MANRLEISGDDPQHSRETDLDVGLAQKLVLPSCLVCSFFPSRIAGNYVLSVLTHSESLCDFACLPKLR